MLKNTIEKESSDHEWQFVIFLFQHFLIVRENDFVTSKWGKFIKNVCKCFRPTCIK